MNDPLNVQIPITEVDTTFPLLAESDQEFTVASSTIEGNYDKTGLQWSLAFSLVNPAVAINGKEIKPGTRFFPDWPLQLQPREDGKGGAVWSGSMAEKSLVATVDAIFGTSLEAGDRPVFNQELVASAVGRKLIGRVVIDTDKNGVQRNKVTRLKKAT